MAIARSMVRGHGGEITLANRLEGGLRVTVHVPKDGTSFELHHKRQRHNGLTHSRLCRYPNVTG